MSEELDAKYEAWIRELTRRKEDIAKNRTMYVRSFIAFMIFSALGYIWGPWIGAGSVLTGILVCLFGCYTVLFREGELEEEIARLRETQREQRERTH